MACPAAEEHFQEQARRGGGGSSGKVSVMSLFCGFYPSLNQVDSRFCLCAHILKCILEKNQIVSP